MNNILNALFVIILLLLPGLLQAEDNVQRIQNLTRQLQQVDQSIESVQRQAGESVERNAGPTPEFTRLNEQLRDLKNQKNDIIEEIQQLASSNGGGSVQPSPLPQPSLDRDPLLRPDPQPNPSPCYENRSGTPSFEGIECR